MSAPARSLASTRITSVRGGAATQREDVLAVEEPLEIRLGHGPETARVTTNLGLTLRTPGHDRDLVAGLLHSEGIIARPTDVRRWSAGDDRDGFPDPNVMVADLAPAVAFDPAMGRRQLRSSACGICGRATLDDLAARLRPLAAGPFRVANAALCALPAALRAAQAAFEETGGLHASALFDPTGRLEGLREDIGRHNAVDKTLGAEFLAGRVPREDRGLVVSGRAGFEILQKAAVAGVPLVAALGAPSSLAVDLAQRFRVTLVGFLKADGFNVYAGPERID